MGWWQKHFCNARQALTTMTTISIQLHQLNTFFINDLMTKKRVPRNDPASEWRRIPDFCLSQ